MQQQKHVLKRSEGFESIRDKIGIACHYSASCMLICLQFGLSADIKTGVCDTRQSSTKQQMFNLDLVSPEVLFSSMELGDIVVDEILLALNSGGSPLAHSIDDRIWLQMQHLLVKL